MAVGNGVGRSVVANVDQGGAAELTPALSPVVGGVSVENRIDLRPVSFSIRPRVQYTVETIYGAIGQQFRTVRESEPGGWGFFRSFERRRTESDPWQPLW